MDAMKMLTDLMGLEIKCIEWEGVKELPFYLTMLYEFRKAEIDECECIIISPKEDLPTIPALRKQIERIQEIWDVPVVIQVDSISTFRRESMIANKISFMTTSELYLPFLGTYLNSKGSKPVKPIERFMVSTQVVFLLFMYGKGDKLYLSDIKEKLPYSAMTISRAANQLVESDFFVCGKEGVKKYILSKFGKKDMYRHIAPFLSSPVTKCMYMAKKERVDRMYLSGFSALSKTSMLNPDSLVTYALYRGDFTKNAKRLVEELLDPYEQVKVEIWSYDPAWFSNGEEVDPISTALSLAEVKDERVEMSVSNMLDNLWEKLNGDRI